MPEPTDEELTRRRTARELVSYCDHMLGPGSDNEEDLRGLRLRIGKWKPFADELIPLCYYMQALGVPADVEVQLHLTNDSYDATIFRSGEKTEYVEVTIAEDTDEYLRRKILHEKRSVFVSGRVVKERERGKKGKKTERVEPEYDGVKNVRTQLARVRCALRRKCLKNPPEGTDLLVMISTDYSFSYNEYARDMLAEFISGHLRRWPMLHYRRVLILGSQSQVIYLERRADGSIVTD